MRFNKPTSCMIYLDANYLYRHNMTQLLPPEILDWVNPKDFNLNNYPYDSPIGPLASEKIIVAEEVLSKYQLQNIEDNNFFLAKNKNVSLI